jgi:hypothetical protein
MIVDRIYDSSYISYKLLEEGCIYANRWLLERDDEFREVEGYDLL